MTMPAAHGSRQRSRKNFGRRQELRMMPAVERTFALKLKQQLRLVQSYAMHSTAPLKADTSEVLSTSKPMLRMLAACFEE